MTKRNWQGTLLEQGYKKTHDRDKKRNTRGWEREIER